MSWSLGYASDVSYVMGYYPEQSPNRIRFSLLMAGWDVPEGDNYLELGFGRGLSLNLHAASNPGEFWGNDFMPVHVAEARRLAAVSGARLLEDSFLDLGKRQGLPEFQFITAHGIYSWVDEERQGEIRRIVNGALGPGGVAYLSFNTQPGWAEMVPVQRLIRLYVEDMSNPADPLHDRLKEAFGLLNVLKQGKAAALEGRPNMEGRIKHAESAAPDYLAHEYLNRGWQPLFFVDVARALEEAKLQFAACSNPMESLSQLAVPQTLTEVFANVGDLVMREQLRDFAVNQSFRRDLFLRGGRRLHRSELSSRLERTRIVPIQSGLPTSWEMAGPAGPMTLREESYLPVLTALHASPKPVSLGELSLTLGIGFATMTEIAAVLVGHGIVAPAHDEATAAAVRKKSQAFNREVRSLATYVGEIAYQASPVTGAGIKADRFQQYFLTATEAKKSSAAELAQYAWKQLQHVGHGAVVDGQALTTERENIEYLTGLAATFLQQGLPFFKKLGVV